MQQTSRKGILEQAWLFSEGGPMEIIEIYGISNYRYMLYA